MGSAMHDVPVLLVAWRRPHTIRQVIDAIRPIAPTRMFIACDGADPSHPGEQERVMETRAVLERAIDWPCTVERRFADVHQGCRLGVSRAITWFFERVEEGIILEDDCVPHPDFFTYCASLLARYRNDDRVWCISGDNFQDGHWRGDGSYYFSRYPHCWGWASWRRCWTYFDSDLQRWPALRSSGLLESMFEDPIERGYWSAIWQRLYAEGVPDSWAYRWTFTCLLHGGLTALPNRNLVENIGFGADATHTTAASARSPAAAGLSPITHPSFLLRDAAADRYTFARHFGSGGRGGWRRLLYRVERLLDRAAGASSSSG